jgi:hypothetical protein
MDEVMQKYYLVTIDDFRVFNDHKSLLRAVRKETENLDNLHVIIGRELKFKMTLEEADE